VGHPRNPQDAVQVRIIRHCIPAYLCVLFSGHALHNAATMLHCFPLSRLSGQPWPPLVHTPEVDSDGTKWVGVRSFDRMFPLIAGMPRPSLNQIERIERRGNEFEATEMMKYVPVRMASVGRMQWDRLDVHSATLCLCRLLYRLARTGLSIWRAHNIDDERHETYEYLPPQERHLILLEEVHTWLVRARYAGVVCVCACVCVRVCVCASVVCLSRMLSYRQTLSLRIPLRLTISLGNQPSVPATSWSFGGTCGCSGRWSGSPTLGMTYPVTCLLTSWHRAWRMGGFGPRCSSTTL
jgi:hypothetical protein